jgi:hypothetical protein
MPGVGATLINHAVKHLQNRPLDRFKHSSPPDTLCTIHSEA